MKRFVQSILLAFLFIAVNAHCATRMVCQVWGSSVHGDAYEGNHAKTETILLRDDGTLAFDGAMDYQASRMAHHRNSVNEWSGVGTWTVGILPNEFLLHLQYERIAGATCNGDQGGQFACAFGSFTPSYHQENHVCFGSFDTKLVCDQIRAFDPPNHRQSPAETTVCTPF